MLQKQSAHNWNDDDGNPAGGTVTTTGLTAVFQNGPLGKGENKKAPTGCFVEDLIEAARQRIVFYQSSEFACDTNALAAEHLGLALEALASRTKDRVERDVEGTHTR